MLAPPSSPALDRDDPSAQHYDADYFAWQRSIGEFSAKANRFRFQPYVSPADRVVDFGCGGGYLLAALACADRMGVEVNPVARQEAERQGITTVPYAELLPDAWADVVISNSALEHVEHPLAELRKIVPKVRPGGRVIVVVPMENLDARYKVDDVNQHLYTWSPLNLGNLVKAAGLVVEDVRASRIMWPPFYAQCYALLGERGFRWLCLMYRAVRVGLSPVIPVGCHAAVVAVARRP
ncbi:MAG: class I SAM-dependent methyltransferase [Gemmatimonadota bacterium]